MYSGHMRTKLNNPNQSTLLLRTPTFHLHVLPATSSFQVNQKDTMGAVKSGAHLQILQN